MVVYAVILAFWRLKQEDCLKLKTSLIYIVLGQPGLHTLWDCLKPKQTSKYVWLSQTQANKTKCVSWTNCKYRKNCFMYECSLFMVTANICLLRETAIDLSCVRNWGIFRNQMSSYFSLTSCSDSSDGSWEHSQFEQFLKEMWKSVCLFIHLNFKS